MIGAMTLGGLVGLAGNIASGVMSSINNKKMEREQSQMYAQRRAKYEAMANEDPLSRSENQRLLNQYDREAKRQVETARNVAAITGATPEYGLAVQKGVAEGRADLMGNMAASASARKDKYTELADETAQQAQQAQLQMDAARNETYANLASNAANAAASIIGGAMKKPTSTPAPTSTTDNTAKLGTSAPPVAPFGKQTVAGIDYTMNTDGTFTGPGGMKFMRNYSMKDGVSMVPMFK